MFISFVVIMCWKIHERVKKLHSGEMYYEAKSHREERVEREEKVNNI
jgi:hypothetical protein